MVKHQVCAVALGGLICLHHHRAGARGRGEAYVHGGGIFILYLNAVKLVKLFDPALHLYSLGGLVPESLNELLRVLDHLLLVAVGGGLLLTTLTSQLNVFGVRHAVVIDLANAYLQSASGDVVKEGTVVRYQHHRAVIGLKELLKPDY